MKLKVKEVFVCFLLTLGFFGMAGCSEGPMEEAGEAVDEAVEDVGEAIDDATEEMEDALEKKKKK